MPAVHAVAQWFKQLMTPARNPGVGENFMYFKSNNALYGKSSAGTEYKIGPSEPIYALDDDADLSLDVYGFNFMGEGVQATSPDGHHVDVIIAGSGTPGSGDVLVTHDSGVIGPPVTAIDFNLNGVDYVQYEGASESGRPTAVVGIPGLAVEDENTLVDDRVYRLNFKGDGVTAAPSGVNHEVNVTIPGGGAGGTSVAAHVHAIRTAGAHTLNQNVWESLALEGTGCVVSEAGLAVSFKPGGSDPYPGLGAYFTINETGLYDLSGSCVFTGNTAGKRVIAIFVNGVLHSQIDQGPAGTQLVSAHVSTTVKLAQGDKVWFAVWQNAGVNLPLNVSPNYYWGRVAKVDAAPGPTGPQGATGVQGPVGATGAQGVQGTPGVQGVKGDTGAQGAQGPKGETGATGTQGPAGADSTVPGPQGPIGPQGPQGDTGATGADSTVPGPQGPQGIKGDTGATGPASTVPGPAGPTGPEGPKGDTGSTGAAGPPGADSTVPGPAGPQGPAGADSTVPGPAGAQGPQGVKGDTGAQGPVGATGAAGADSTVPGPTGPAGPEGPEGPQGVKGDTGSTGAPGTAGAQGPQGVKGDTGATGTTGAQGPPGTTGAQGPKGDTGSQGPQGIQGPVGPQGPAGAAGAGAPLGAVLMWPTATPPADWLICDGAAIPAQYTGLIALVGATTPDLRNRVPVGVGTAHAVGTNDGLAEASRDVIHNHSTPNHTHTDNFSVGQNVTVKDVAAGSNSGTATTAHPHPLNGSIQSSGAATTGAGGPAYQALNFIIRAV